MHRRGIHRVPHSLGPCPGPRYPRWIVRVGWFCALMDDSFIATDHAPPAPSPVPPGRGAGAMLVVRIAAGVASRPVHAPVSVAAPPMLVHQRDGHLPCVSSATQCLCTRVARSSVAKLHRRTGPARTRRPRRPQRHRHRPAPGPTVMLGRRHLPPWPAALPARHPSRCHPPKHWPWCDGKRQPHVPVRSPARIRVEPRGVEPRTSAVQRRRSPS